MLFIIGYVTLECFLVMSHEGHVNSVSLRPQPFTCPPRLHGAPSAPRLPLSSGFLRGGLGFGSVPGVYRVEVFSLLEQFKGVWASDVGRSIPKCPASPDLSACGDD